MPCKHCKLSKSACDLTKKTGHACCAKCDHS